MTANLRRLCLDTNVYIIGIQDLNSPEARILKAIGYFGDSTVQVTAEIILSDEIIDQVRRVGKYLWNKDKAGFAIGLMWSRLNEHLCELQSGVETRIRTNYKLSSNS